MRSLFLSGRKRLGIAGDVLLLATGFALFTGLAEAARIGFLRVALDRFVWLPSDAPWMAPLAYLIYFAVPAVVIASLFLVFPRLQLWMATFPFALLSAFSFLTLIGRFRIAGWAIGVLAMGLAIGATRWTRDHDATLRRLLIRANLAMALLVVCLSAALPGSRAWQRRAALAGLGQAPAGVPNVLLIILDTVRAASLSLYGYDRPTTPNLERWAKRGVVFQQAFSTAPWTLPSHSSLFTGLWPHQLTSNWRRPLSDSAQTLAEVFRARGYNTAGFVANTNYAGRDSGLGRGFIEYSDFRQTIKQFFYVSSLGQIVEGLRKGRAPYYPWSHRKGARQVSADFLNWQAKNGNRPFFVFLNYFDAHAPYLPPRPFRDKLAHSNRSIAGYDGAIAFLDDRLNELFEEMDRRGVLDNTLVIVTSDHGELLGEHGLQSHGISLYLPELQVPLVMLGPRVPANTRVELPVTLRDVPQTILELSVGAGDFPGHSLAGTWNAPASAVSPLLFQVRKGINTAPEFPVSKGDMFSVLLDGWHYIRNGDGAEELYSTTSDPTESRNLANNPSAGAELTRFRAAVTRLVSGQSAEGLKAK